MPNIKPISDLHNSTEILEEGKNRSGKYVLVDIEEYENQETTLITFSRIE